MRNYIFFLVLVSAVAGAGAACGGSQGASIDGMSPAPDAGTSGDTGVVEAADAPPLDADATAPSTLRLAWSKVLGPDARVEVVDTDASGYVGVVGDYARIDFGSGVVSAPGARSGFAAMFNANGQLAWSWTFGDHSSRGVGGALTSDGGLVVAGLLKSESPMEIATVTFSPPCQNVQTRGASSALILAKFDRAGNCAWNHAVRAPSNGLVTSAVVAVDLSGNAFLAGSSTAGSDVDGVSLQSPFWLLKWSASGAREGFESIPAGDVHVDSLVADGSGGIVLAGRFLGSFDNQVIHRFTQGAFAESFDAMGGRRWAKEFGGEIGQDRNFGSGVGIAVDAADEIVFTLQTHGDVDFGGGPLSSGPGANLGLFVGRLGKDGTHKWSREFATGYAISGARSRARALQDGTVALFGTFQSTLDLGGMRLSSPQQETASAMYFAGVSATGNVLWHRQFGEVGSEEGSSLASSASGAVVLGGALMSPTDFGGGKVSPLSDASPSGVVVVFETR